MQESLLLKSNYDVWSQLMEMHIAEREKLSYIRGKKPPPKESDEGYEKWYAKNQKVKRWLLMSMSPEIMSVMSAYPLLTKSGVLYPKLSMMEEMSYLSSPCTKKPLLLNKMEGHSLSIMEN
ncbi:hypothetical protein Patl1_09689 [Pistacia atlantica]|uniref:Uncharacterized protein n=1 Tax=Pistacia atlantica TaxID=434234 RepID=A0ACC1A256_9ROSI|nr:hypothetical protein Patl1_09689 [Pistacia atlantica]